jgi:hypothetical protein
VQYHPKLNREEDHMANQSRQSTQMKIGPFTGAYAQGLFEASAIDEKQEPKYGITLLVPKAVAEKELAQLKKMIAFVAAEKFGPNWVKLPNFKLPIRDGDVEKPDKKEFAGMMFIGARSKNPPGVVDRHLKRITDKDEAYSGCKFVLQVNVYAFDAGGSKGVALGLNNALVFEKGERIDGRIGAEEAFAEFAESGEGGGSENPLD